MKHQILFSRKNKKCISKCCLLKILPRVLSVKLNNLAKGFLSCLSKSLNEKGIVLSRDTLNVSVIKWSQIRIENDLYAGVKSGNENSFLL